MSGIVSIPLLCSNGPKKGSNEELTVDSNRQGPIRSTANHPLANEVTSPCREQAPEQDRGEQFPRKRNVSGRRTKSVGKHIAQARDKGMCQPHYQ